MREQPTLTTLKIPLQERKEGRGIIVKKTQKDHKPYIATMGYHVAMCRYMGSEEYRFSGSTINRKKKIDAAQYKEKIFETIKETTFHSVDEYVQWQQYINEQRQIIADNRANKINKRRTSYWLSPAQNRRSMPVHEFSARSRAKVRDKFTAFYRASKRRKAFVTLTFIQSVTDELAVKILNKFLTVLRKEFDDLQYIWVAERQQSGNIHFHIIINRRTNKNRLAYYNGLWLLEQYNSGLRKEKMVFDFMGYDVSGKEIPVYVGTGEYYTIEQIRAAFANGTSQQIANPFNIKAINSVYHLSYYLTTYISKQGAHNRYKCRIWHCSRAISKLFTKAAVSRSCFSNTTTWVNAVLDRKTGEMIFPTLHKGQYFLMTYINNKVFFYRYLKEMEQINNWILSGFPVAREDILTNDYDYRKFILNQN